MSASMRTTPRLARSFAATATKQPVRHLHITSAKEQPSKYLKSAIATEVVKAAASPARTFNTTRSLKSPKDTSTVDFTYFPTLTISELSSGSVSGPMNIPIIPDAFMSHKASSSMQAALSAGVIASPDPAFTIVPTIAHEGFESDIETVSMSHEGQVSPMTEGDAMEEESDVFHIVGKIPQIRVQVKEEVKREVGIVREVWDGLVEDIFGKKGRAA